MSNEQMVMKPQRRRDVEKTKAVLLERLRQRQVRRGRWLRGWARSARPVKTTPSRPAPPAAAPKGAK